MPQYSPIEQYIPFTNALEVAIRKGSSGDIVISLGSPILTRMVSGKIDSVRFIFNCAWFDLSEWELTP